MMRKRTSLSHYSSGTSTSCSGFDCFLKRHVSLLFSRRRFISSQPSSSSSSSSSLLLVLFVAGFLVAWPDADAGAAGEGVAGPERAAAPGVGAGAGPRPGVGLTSELKVTAGASWRMDHSGGSMPPDIVAALPWPGTSVPAAPGGTAETGR